MVEAEFGESCDGADTDPFDGCIECVALSPDDCNLTCAPEGTSPQATHVYVADLDFPANGASVPASGMALSGDSLLVLSVQAAAEGAEREVVVDEYRRDQAGAWPRMARLNGGRPLDLPGTDIRLHHLGDHAVIWNQRTADRCATGALAWVHRRDAQGRWSQWQPLLGSVEGACAEGGITVAVDGQTIAIGLEGAEVPVRRKGIILLFELNADGVWTETLRIVEPDGLRAEGRGSGFGGLVALGGRFITTLCLACSTPDAPDEIAGAVVLERHGNGGWRLVQGLYRFDRDFRGAIVTAHQGQFYVGLSQYSGMMPPDGRPIWHQHAIEPNQAGTWTLGALELKSPERTYGETNNIGLLRLDDLRAAVANPGRYVIDLFSRLPDGPWQHEKQWSWRRGDGLVADGAIAGDATFVRVEDLNGRTTAIRHYRRTLRPACDAQGACICKPGWSGERCQIAP